MTTNNSVGKEECNPHWWRGDKTFGKRICARCGAYEKDQPLSPQSSVGVEEKQNILDNIPIDEEGHREFFTKKEVFQAMTEYSSLMNKEKDRDVEELKFGIENFIKWLEEHRPKVAGLGAPIHILKELLNK